MKNTSDIFVKNSTRAHLPYLKDFLFYELASPVFRSLIYFLTKDSVFMKFVFAFGNVFQICQRVVSRVSIFMVNLFSFRARTNESKHDESMKLPSFSFSVFSQPHLQSPFATFSRLHNEGDCFVWTVSLNKTAYFARIRDVVNSIVT